MTLRPSSEGVRKSDFHIKIGQGKGNGKGAALPPPPKVCRGTLGAPSSTHINPVEPCSDLNVL